MPDTRYGDYVQRMTNYCSQALVTYHKFHNFADFFYDIDARNSTLFSIIQLAESAGRLRDAITREDVPWGIKQLPLNEIRSMRNIIVHDYEGVDFHVLQQTLDRDLPKLLEIFRADGFVPQSPTIYIDPGQFDDTTEFN